MNISLTPELERLVTDSVETGLYETATDVVREGLHLLLERDQRAEALQRDVLAGFDAVERGSTPDTLSTRSPPWRTVSRF